MSIDSAAALRPMRASLPSLYPIILLCICLTWTPEVLPLTPGATQGPTSIEIVLRAITHLHIGLGEYCILMGKVTLEDSPDTS